VAGPITKHLTITGGAGYDDVSAVGLDRLMAGAIARLIFGLPSCMSLPMFSLTRSSRRKCLTLRMTTATLSHGPHAVCVDAGLALGFRQSVLSMPIGKSLATLSSVTVTRRERGSDCFRTTL
jgi:hypothetical protein